MAQGRPGTAGQQRSQLERQGRRRSVAYEVDTPVQAMEPAFGDAVRHRSTAEPGGAELRERHDSAPTRGKTGDDGVGSLWLRFRTHVMRNFNAPPRRRHKPES